MTVCFVCIRGEEGGPAAKQTKSMPSRKRGSLENDIYQKYWQTQKRGTDTIQLSLGAIWTQPASLLAPLFSSFIMANHRSVAIVPQPVFWCFKVFLSLLVVPTQRVQLITSRTITQIPATKSTKTDLTLQYVQRLLLLSTGVVKRESLPGDSQNLEPRTRSTKAATADWRSSYMRAHLESEGEGMDRH